MIVCCGIAEVAAAASGDAYLFTYTAGMINNQHRPAPFARFNSSHKPCSTGSDNNNIIMPHGFHWTLLYLICGRHAWRESLIYELIQSKNKLTHYLIYAYSYR